MRMYSYMQLKYIYNKISKCFCSVISNSSIFLDNNNAGEFYNFAYVPKTSVPIIVEAIF